MSMSRLPATLSPLILLGSSFVVWAGDSPTPDHSPASSVEPVESDGGLTPKFVGESAPTVEIRFENRRSDLPPGVSLVTPSGGLVNNSFPALSIGGNKVAVFYLASPSVEHAYPALDIYCSETSQLEERFEFFPDDEQRLGGQNLNGPEVQIHVEHRVLEANRYLSQNGFRSLPALFQFDQLGHAPMVTESLGKQIAVELDLDSGSSTLAIASAATGRTQLKMTMPVISVIEGTGDPYTDCSVQGFPRQGWYDPGSGVVVLRLEFSSARDDCDQPDQWVTKRM